MASAIDKLLKKTDTVKNIILRTKSHTLHWDKNTVTISELKVTLSDLDVQKQDVLDLYKDVSNISDSDEMKVHDPTFNTLFGAIRSMQVDTLELLAAKEATAKAKVSPSFKLERIKLPQFRGIISEWQSFHDLFVSSVDKNPTLSGAEKMIHLKSSLVGDAAAIVSSFQATDSNYKQAWDMVVKRYSNHREIVFAHIRKFDDLKSTQIETSQGLRTVADTINEFIRSLTNLKVPVSHWDLIIIYLALKKLSPETRKQWILEDKSALPTVDKFIEYLEARARALADSENTYKSKSGTSGTKKASSHVASGTSSITCPKCSESHHLHKCKTFIESIVADRRDFVTKKQLCFNCLFSNHSVAKCGMKFSCNQCGKRHHSLLHIEPVIKKPTMSSTATVNSDVEIEEVENLQSVSSSHCTPLKNGNIVVLMGTLIVNVTNSEGIKQTCRVFVDPGSESNFITENCVDRLGLKRKKTCVNVSGISGSKGETANGIIKTVLSSTVRDFDLSINALILRKITNQMPRVKCNFDWPHLQGLKLGDPSFNTPGHVDILLGAADAAYIMRPGIKFGEKGAPSAQNTQFGWMLSGCIQASLSSYHVQISSNHSHCGNNEPCLETTMSKFWELEEPEIPIRNLSKEDETCEVYFQTTHIRNLDGSYTVKLPFRSTSSSLGQSRSSALQRLHRVEKQLAKNPETKAEYIKGIREYISANFMELVPPEEISKSHESSYYMPHHVVVKPSSTSTKYRIVYDASAKTSTGKSLNDILMTGPKLQIDLVPLLIRFRSYRVAMSADIVKFYPQFKVDKDHVDFMRLVWREDPSYPIQDYRMLRLTFGVTSAPFLAIRCLHQLADDEKDNFPLATSIIKEDFLVDNLLSGSDDIQSALSIQHQILNVMERGNLQLSKWSSNQAEIVQAVPPEQRESEFPLTIKEDEALKTIGLLWNPAADTFGVSINIPNLPLPITKRKVLSSIAKTFDPLGWLSPVTVTPKILLQLIWKEKLDWDTPLPLELCKIWIDYCRDLELLQAFRLNRCLMDPSSLNSNSEYELHGFSDASLLAYAACVYLKTVSVNGNYINLIIAKTKVSPIKTETIPRLELCAASLLAKLIKTVKTSISLKVRAVHCWTDSTIVLDWLKSTKKLPIFVANRVCLITAIVPSNCWSHVDGTENPADAASRGITPVKFLSSTLWLNGPEGLKESDGVKVKEENSFPTEIIECSLSEFINNSSSFSRMKRVIAYCKRFINNCQNPNNQRFGNLMLEELKSALHIIIGIVQQQSFGDEISHLQSGLQIKSRNKFLCPFLDSAGLLRVGGRLSHSSLNYDQQHPFLLPKNHQFTDTLVKYYHINNLHAGPQLLLSLIRDRFWIVRGPDIVKRIVHQCVTCHRQNPATTTQLMGQLPFARVNLTKTFSHTGMDYAGPFSLCLIKGRNPKIMKSYVCIFICMATRAIHLELVGDVSTPSFVAALSRFMARRGLPTDVYCDGGTNFLGAKNEMLEFSKLMKSAPHKHIIGNFYASKEIKYHVNPPLAPHHGGLWEAGVKSMKYHLKRVTQDKRLSIEEFSTLLCQVEAALNSRPLTQLSSDPNDVGVLTPGHFLVGESLLSLPQHDLTETKMNRLSRWQIVQQISQHFWRRWHSEYLNTLQSRPKWFTPQPNLDVGILVLIRDDEPTWGPLKWKLGRISATYPGSDGKVRVCDVKSATGKIYTRSVVKLSPLPIYN